MKTAAAGMANARSSSKPSSSSLAGAQPNLRTVVTESSVWRFDLDGMIYVRLPKDEFDPQHPLPYTGEWEPYECIEPYGDRLVVHRPVPWGTGARRMTGPVWSDTHSGSWPRDVEIVT